MNKIELIKALKKDIERNERNYQSETDERVRDMLYGKLTALDQVIKLIQQLD